MNFDTKISSDPKPKTDPLPVDKQKENVDQVMESPPTQPQSQVQEPEILNENSVLESESTPSQPPIPVSSVDPQNVTLLNEENDLLENEKAPPMKGPEPIPADKAPQINKPKGSFADGISKTMLILGPLFLIVSLSISFYMIKSVPSTLQSFPVEQKVVKSEPVKTQEKPQVQNLVKEKVAFNPQEIVGTCQNSGVVLENGKSNDCDQPMFNWEAGIVQEENVEILGYQVYFGPKANPDLTKEGRFQAKTTFTSSQLTKPQTNYLFVRTVTNSTDNNYKYGYDINNIEGNKFDPNNIKFEYIYE
jgi:hypothetical protein